MAGYADPFKATAAAATGATSATQTAAPALPPGMNPADWTDWYLNNEPSAGWVAYLQSQGLFGIDPRSKYARNQYGRAYGAYQSAASQDPNLGFYDWLRGAGLDYGAEFANQAPVDRGDFSDRTVNTRARFMRAY